MDPFRHDPEAPPDDRRFGSGWLSGVLATLLGGSRALTRFDIESDVYLGLDWAGWMAKQ